MITNKHANGSSVFYEANVSTCNILNATQIAIFQGVMPDLSTLKSFTASYGLTGASACSQLALLDANCLGLLTCPVLKSIQEYGAEGMTTRIPLSSILTDLVGLRNGTPTFFVMMSKSAANAATWAGFASTGIVQNIFIGSVSDVEGDGELRILGGAIQAGVRYRLTDLSIHL